jgi:hypothetical protein
MNPYVRERITRKLDTLSDERLYQILDYVEFLDSKYAEKSASAANVFTRFAEGVEDKLRAGGVAVSTVAETMGFLNKAMGVLNGVAQTTMSVAGDVVNAAKTAADQVGAPPAAPAPTASPTASPAPGTATGVTPEGMQPAPGSTPPRPPEAAA